jgi:hypothetical protein
MSNKTTKPKTKQKLVSVFPEWLDRDDLSNDTPWNVTSASAQRGDAFTDIKNRRMKVPMGTDPLSRVIRAHEALHAKVSPEIGPAIPLDWADTIHPELVESAEELRVNYLAKRLGFDMDMLKDGSEQTSGEILTNGEDLMGIMRMVSATYGTKSCTAFMRGIKKAVDAGADAQMYQFAKDVKKVCARHERSWNRQHASRIASTEPYSIAVSSKEDDDGETSTEYASVPKGYRAFTLPLARDLSRMVTRSKAERKASEGIHGEGVSIGGDTGFAVPIIDKIPLTERVAGRLGRRRVATDIGKAPRRISRMLTDPDQRVFDKTIRGVGGVILIDQSGSMQLDTDDLWQIIKASPGCVVIGYSHQIGSSDEPNIWVLADRGMVVKNVRSGNGGNVVDGPALAFALSMRRKSEPFIWLCDGYVTDGQGDQQRTELTKQCISIVQKHGIHMTYDVTETVEALKKVARGDKLPVKITRGLEY